MRIVAIISVLFFLFFDISSQNTNDNDLKLFNLNGRVKYFSIATYDAEFDIDTIIKTKRLNIPWKYEVFFNNNGFITNDKNFSGNDLISATSQDKYDNFDNLIEHKTFDRNKKINTKTLYTYDYKNNLIKKMFYDNYGLNSKTIYKYDKLGNVIVETDYHPNGIVNYKISYKYNTVNNKTSEIFYDSNWEIKWSVKYQYNSNRKIIERKTYEINDEYSGKMTFEYDEKGNKILEIWFDAKGNISDSMTYKYIFDDDNNWISKTTFKFNKPKFVTDRVIVYYE